MEKLPKEVVEMILSKLKDPKDLSNFEAAAKVFTGLQWGRLRVRVRLDSTIPEHDRWDRVMTIIQRALASKHMHGLRQLKLELGAMEDGIVSMSRALDWSGLEHCRSSLRVLKICSLSIEAPFSWGFWKSISNFPNLSVVDLISGSLARPKKKNLIFFSFPSLTKLRFFRVGGLRMDVITAIQKASPLLESLLIETSPGDPEDDSSNGILILDHAERLKHLVYDSHGSNARMRLIGCHHLEKLTMIGEHLEISNSSFSRLQKLHLWGPETLGFLSLLSGCKQLKRLVLGSSRGADGPVVIRCSSLTSMIYNTETPFENRPQVLQLECERLQTLKIEGNCQLKVESLRDLSKLCLSMSWEYEALRELLAMDFVRESLVRLDMIQLDMSSVDQSSLDRFPLLLERSSCLRRVDLPLNEEEIDKTGLVEQVLGSFFSRHIQLQSLSLTVVPGYGDQQRFHRAMNVVEVPGLRVEMVENKWCKCVFHRDSMVHLDKNVKDLDHLLKECKLEHS